jgi:hypothetical protein
MQNELANDESPLDANLQSVLPGVHQRLEVQREEISCLRGDIGRLTVAVENHTLVFNDKVEEIISMNDEKMEVLGRMHIMVGSRLLGETVEGEGSPSSSPPSSPPPRPPPTSRRVGEGDEAPKYHLALSPKSLFAIYNEWYGGGPDFQDIPVPGGIAALENKFKARWRRHFEPNEVKDFSRRRMCINAISAYATREGISEVRAIDLLNTIYEEDAKKKVPTMADIVQNMGLIEKKNKRGKGKDPPEQ